ncbi:hypothetical protein F442_12396 [Phytophthora nicotianae P10297]|uniref:Uncharacterized protein n=3 Tax=Phytophthora nicotianae TaxID=4792 RepID=V9EWG4_PHYNI|nr:hypothetical protein F443_12482 [Phytophthora nicotianae P1569]ETO71011.1 hypothetical protein F444_12575 [Phytophthora nicotianae P1976]ETP40232.1 hypothetical protein F442_12396 [Phytophthora nicotianae P10297]
MALHHYIGCTWEISNGFALFRCQQTEPVRLQKTLFRKFSRGCSSNGKQHLTARLLSGKSGQSINTKW